MATLALEICAIDRAAAKMDVTEVVLPGSEGIFVVLPGHAPMLATLDIGVLTTTLPDGTQQSFALNGGFCHVLDEHVLVLSQTVETGEEIDLERAEAAKVRAEERLRTESPDIDMIRAETALKRAFARIEVAKQIRH